MGIYQAFSWLDYSFFVIMAIISISIGLYFGCFGTKQKTLMEYIMGNRKMKVVPVAMSLLASHITAKDLLTLPSEVYTHGTFFVYSSISMAFMVLFSFFISLPVIFHLKLISFYEYFEMRFDRKCRKLASFAYSLIQFLVLPIAMYIPALAASSMTGLDLNFVIIISCSLCIFYTTIGGLKTVIWTDILQLVLIIAAGLTIIILGSEHEGGFYSVWNKAKRGGRFDIFDFELDPTKRDSFWGYFIGFTIRMIANYNIKQCNVQKLLLVPTLNDAKWVLGCYAMFFVIYKLASIYLGLLLYARYANCDPLLNGKIQKIDQIVPYYLSEFSKNIPGFSGLFIGGVYAAAFSTFSAYLNCLGISIYEDFLSRWTARRFTDYQKSCILKLIICICGILCTSLVFFIEDLGPIFPLSYTLSSLATGPLFGMYLLGLLTHIGNSKGAFYGSIMGFATLVCYATTALYLKREGALYFSEKTVSTIGCNITSNISVTSNVTMTSSKNEGAWIIFKLSYMYYTILGCLVTFVCGLLISYFTKDDRLGVKEELLCKWIRKKKQNSQHIFEEQSQSHILVQ